MLNASLIVVKNNVPALQFYRRTTDMDQIKFLVECALNDKPFLVSLTYKNKLILLNSLIESGIMSYNKETKEYSYNF